MRKDYEDEPIGFYCFHYIATDEFGTEIIYDSVGKTIYKCSYNNIITQWKKDLGDLWEICDVLGWTWIRDEGKDYFYKVK